MPSAHSPLCLGIAAKDRAISLDVSDIHICYSPCIRLITYRSIHLLSRRISLDSAELLAPRGSLQIDTTKQISHFEEKTIDV